MSGDIAVRDVNTPQVRQAIAESVADQLGPVGRATAARVTGEVYVILDRASAGLPLAPEGGR